MSQMQRRRWSLIAARSLVVAGALLGATATGFAQSLPDVGARAALRALDQRLLFLNAAEFDPLGGPPTLPQGVQWSVDELTAADVDYFIVQLRTKVTPEDHVDLIRNGADEVGYIPNNAFLVRAAATSIQQLRDWPRTRAIVPFQPAYRVDPDLLADATRPDLTTDRILDLAVFLFDGADPGLATLALLQLGAELLDPDAGLRTHLNVRARADSLVRLAHVRDVQWIEPQATITRRNDSTAWVVQSNITDQTPAWDQGTLGDGVIIGHIDDPIDIASCFFFDPAVSAPGPTHRKIVAHHGSYSNPTMHGTHTAGTAAGDQEPINGVTDANGMAYHARLAHSNLAAITSTNLSTKLAELLTDGARVFTNSWGDDSTTKYNAWCVAIDDACWDNWDTLICFAETERAFLKNPENAKNLLAVGASDQSPNQAMLYKGGKGPTKDGRRKPEIFAPGKGIISADVGASCGTTSMSGTSMACPTIAGAAALVKQYFESGYFPSGTANALDAVTPSGALLKAVLLDAAVDMTGVTGYPSDGEGWGRLLLDDGLYFPGDSRHLWVSDVLAAEGLPAPGQTQTHYILVNGSALSLELCLCFMDKAGTINSSQPVVNDLDLEVLAPDGSLYLGNAFSGGVSVTGGTADPLNNVERVKLPGPPTGWYTVTIRATTIATATSQPYALVATGDIDPPLKGSFELYGSGLAGTGGLVPVIAGSGSPTIGSDVSIDVTNGLGGAFALVLIGFDRANIPFAGGTLLVLPPLFAEVTLNLDGTPGVPGDGTLNITDTIPDDPTIIGVLVDIQALIVDPGAVKKTAITQGLEIAIGS